MSEIDTITLAMRRPEGPGLPADVRMAREVNGMPMVGHRRLGSGAPFKIAFWRGRLQETRTTPRADYHTICAHLGGATVTRRGHGASDLTAGATFIQPMHDEGSFNSRGSVSYAHPYLSVALMADVCAELGHDPRFATDLPMGFGCRDIALNGVVEAAIRSLTVRRYAMRLELEHWGYLLALALALLRHRLSGEPSQDNSSTAVLSARQLKRLCDFIEDNSCSP